MSRPTIEVDELVLVAKTDKAILVRKDDVEEGDEEEGENQWWVALSLIEWRDMYNIGDEGSIEIPEWLAEEKGMA